MRILAITFFVLGVAALMTAAALPTSCSATPDDGKGPTLDWIKRFEGEWLQVGEDGKPTEVVVSRYKVTAGGSAVLEILFPGSDHEMVTVYYQDGDQLMLTHFCVLGNQPTMRARYGKTQKEVHYDFVSASNMKEDDPHMHQGMVTIIDDNRIKSAWQKFSKGEPDGVHGFELVRKAS